MGINNDLIDNLTNSKPMVQQMYDLYGKKQGQSGTASTVHISRPATAEEMSNSTANYPH